MRKGGRKTGGGEKRELYLTRNWDARKVFGLSLVLIFIFISFSLLISLFPGFSVGISL